MINIPLAGETRAGIILNEDTMSLDGFRHWRLDHRHERLGLDTETTGLDIFAPGFQVRLVQVSDRDTSWVLHPGRYHEGQAILDLLREHQGRFVLHNAPFDAQALSRYFGINLRDLLDQFDDTRTLAHFLDTRTRPEGGTGHKLKEVSTVYVDPNASDGEAELIKEFRKHGWTKETGWALIDIDNPVYTYYAAQDPLLARHLWDELWPLVEATRQDSLYEFEHEMATICAEIVARGMRVDVPYTEQLVGALRIESETYKAKAANYGVANVNSNAQIIEAITAMGETLTEKTPSGQPKVDNAVLLPMADLNKDWERLEAREPNYLVDAVIRAKRAAKWKTTYAEAFLARLDDQGRLHASLNPLAARTARMSVSNPPLQQLPSGDATIRSCFIADPGHVIISSDFAQVEMRVLAALCRDANMLKAILSGEDLHDFTATMVFGPDFTSKQRKLAKAVGLGKVYGGGATVIQRQTGAPMAGVKAAIAKYDEIFPGIKRYGYDLQRRAQYGTHEVVTPSGRHLILDRDRAYAATNYMCQSTARDLMAQALVNIWDEGLGHTVLNVVHDEVIAQAPIEDAEDIRKRIEEAMNMTFVDVPIIAEAEIFGASWGDGYKK